MRDDLNATLDRASREVGSRPWWMRSDENRREAEPAKSEFTVSHYASGTRKTQLPREGELWMEAADGFSMFVGEASPTHVARRMAVTLGFRDGCLFLTRSEAKWLRRKLKEALAEDAPAADVAAPEPIRVAQAPVVGARRGARKAVRPRTGSRAARPLPRPTNRTRPKTGTVNAGGKRR